MKTMQRIATGLAGVALLLGGCGGSDGPPPIAYVAGSDVPVSATQSIANTIAFAAQQQAMGSDSSEPIALGEAVFATDDSAEPADV